MTEQLEVGMTASVTRPAVLAGAAGLRLVIKVVLAAEPPALEFFYIDECGNRTESSHVEVPGASKSLEIVIPGT